MFLHVGGVNTYLRGALSVQARSSSVLFLEQWDASILSCTLFLIMKASEVPNARSERLHPLLILVLIINFLFIPSYALTMQAAC